MADKLLEVATDAPIFTLDGVTTRGKVVKVYDGDTCTIIMPVQGRLLKFNCRLLGINAPEFKPPKSLPDREEEVAAAKLTQAALANMVLGKVVTVRCGKHEKYGRVLVELWNESAAGNFVKATSVNQEMVKRNLANVFMNPEYKKKDVNEGSSGHDVAVEVVYAQAS